jgi:hypothetical protein
MGTFRFWTNPLNSPSRSMNVIGAIYPLGCVPAKVGSPPTRVVRCAHPERRLSPGTAVIRPASAGLAQADPQRSLTSAHRGGSPCPKCVIRGHAVEAPDRVRFTPLRPGAPARWQRSKRPYPGATFSEGHRIGTRCTRNIWSRRFRFEVSVASPARSECRFTLFSPHPDGQNIILDRSFDEASAPDSCGESRLPATSVVQKSCRHELFGLRPYAFSQTELRKSGPCGAV